MQTNTNGSNIINLQASNSGSGNSLTQTSVPPIGSHGDTFILQQAGVVHPTDNSQSNFSSPNQQVVFLQNQGSHQQISAHQNPLQLPHRQAPYSLQQQNHGPFSPQQIERLQSQIKHFKALGKRYGELVRSSSTLVPSAPSDGGSVSSLGPSTGQSGVTTQHRSTAQPPTPSQNTSHSLITSSSSPYVNPNPSASGGGNHVPLPPPPQPPLPAPSQPAPPPQQRTVESSEPGPTTLSWQCFYSLLYTGPTRPLDNTISIPPSESGSFSKAANLPLVLTSPYVAGMREKYIAEVIGLAVGGCGASVDPAASAELRSLKLLKLQRQERAGLISQHVLKIVDGIPHAAGLSALHPLSLTGPGGYGSQLLQRRQHQRVKRQTKRDVVKWEKEERRRKNEVDEKKRKRGNEYLKAVMAHREDFLRFHKHKRSECTKAARAVKSVQDMAEMRRERDENKAEVRRIQALKENDMEAYTKLLAETKNERLHHLINQTDTYIATINRMVLNQRSDDVEGEEGKGTSSSTTGEDSAESRGKLTKASKDYYDSTHKRVEKVMQPTMLKGGDLKEYQLGGLQWMVSLYNNHLNGILADEMGLGKTIQTIALLAYLMEFKGNKGPFMIVVPLSTLSNWVNETSKWAPDIIKVVYKGSPLARKQLYKDEVEPGHFNLLLTTYEYIMKDKSLLRKHVWQYIIVDEGHRMKNAQSKFAQTLGAAYQSKHRILLTGTPLQNNLPELWALLNFLLPSIFSSVDTFDQWFNKPFATFKNPTAATGAMGEGETEVASLNQEEKMLIVHRLHEVLRPFMLRRVKDQVLDQLPEKVEKVLRCELSGWQRKLYNTIHQRSIASKEKDGGSGPGMNNAIMQLRKVCNHPYLFLSEWYMDDDLIRAAGKFELLDRMLPKLKAAGHRVLMFSQMTQLMTILERFFDMKGFQYLRLDGGTASDEREKRMYMFNDPDSPFFIFLLSTRAGGLGLNLATADTVILFDSDWNPMMDAQAQDRAHRIGQKNEVHVFRLVTTSPVEEKILSRATDKRTMTGLVVEAGKFNRDKGSLSGNADKDRKEMMESLLNELASGEGGDEEEEEAVPDDDQINEMMASSPEELELYRRMDLEREQERQRKWKDSLILAGKPVVPIPTALMLATESPTWLVPTLWTNKLLQTADVAPTKKGKRGRKRKNAVGEVGSEFEKGVDDAVLEEDDGQDDDEAGVGFDEHDDHDEEGVVIAGKLMRKRKETVYDDGLTELQFQKMLERQADGVEEQVKQGKLERKKEAKARSSNAAQQKQTLPMGQGLHDETNKVLLKIIAELQKIKKQDGSLLGELFKVKPDKVMYADYYQIVEEPISFKEMTAKLKKAQYRAVHELELDMALMSHNARVYNSDVSPVFHDCEKLRSAFYERAKAAGLVTKSVAPLLPASSHWINVGGIGSPSHEPGNDLAMDHSTSSSPEETEIIYKTEVPHVEPLSKKRRVGSLGTSSAGPKSKIESLPSHVGTKSSSSAKLTTPVARSRGYLDDEDDDDDQEEEDDGISHQQHDGIFDGRGQENSDGSDGEDGASSPRSTPKAALFLTIPKKLAINKSPTMATSDASGSSHGGSKGVGRPRKSSSTGTSKRNMS